MTADVASRARAILMCPENGRTYWTPLLPALPSCITAVVIIQDEINLKTWAIERSSKETREKEEVPDEKKMEEEKGREQKGFPATNLEGGLDQIHWQTQILHISAKI